MKIHLHNVRLLKEIKDINSDLKKAKVIYRYVQKSLPAVETYIRNYCNSNEIKGIIGITHINKGCERLGFEVVDIIHPVYKWFKRLAFLSIGVLSTKDTSIWNILKQQNPYYLFMSTSKLSNMYGHLNVKKEKL